MNTKIIRSRSQKLVGDIIGERWKIIAVKVIAPPHKGNPPWDPPRLGIYEYTVEPTPFAKRVKQARDIVEDITAKRLHAVGNAIVQGRLDYLPASLVVKGINEIFRQEKVALRKLNRLKG